MTNPKLVLDPYNYQGDRNAVRSLVGNKTISEAKANLDKSLTQGENQTKVEQHDGIWNSLKKLFLQSEVQIEQQAGSNTLKLLTDPGEIIGGVGSAMADINTPNKIAKVEEPIKKTFIEELDAVLGSFLSEEKYTDENGIEQSRERTPLKSLGYKPTPSLIETALNIHKSLFNKTKVGGLIPEEVIQKSRDVIQDIGEKLAPLANNKPSNIPFTDIENPLSRWAYQWDDSATRRQEEIVPINTGIKPVDWALNSLPSLVASVASSYLTYGALGKVGSWALKTKLLSSSAQVQKIAKSLYTANMAVIGTGSETMQINKATYLQAKDEIIRSIDKDYDTKESQFIENSVKQITDTNPDIKLSVDDTYRELIKSKREYQKQWLLEQNDSTKLGIEEQSMNAYNLSTAINMINLAFEPIQAHMFLHGKSASRSILASPTRFDYKQAFLKGGLPEIPEELNNSIAQNAGVAISQGKEYGFNEVVKYIFSPSGANDAFWGLIGGHLQGSLGNMTTYKARMADFNAQQKIITKQNNIGTATQATISQFTNLNNSYQGTLQVVNNVNALNNSGNTEAAKLENEKLLSYQAEQAFISGTTQNLIDNYNKIANSDKFNDETKKNAKDAVRRINELEKIYTESSDYLNGRDIYHNQANAVILKETLQAWELEKQTVMPKALLELQDAFKNKTLSTKGLDEFDLISNAEITNLVDETNTNRSLYDTFLNESNKIKNVQRLRTLHAGINSIKEVISETEQQYNNLTSRRTQHSAWKMGKFYEEMAQFEYDQTKNDENFDKYSSDTYKTLFEKKLNSIKNRLTTEDFNQINDDYLTQKKYANKLKSLIEQAIADRVVREPAVVNSPAPVDNSTPETQEALSSIDEVGTAANEQSKPVNNGVTDNEDIAKKRDAAIKDLDTKKVGDEITYNDKTRKIQSFTSNGDIVFEDATNKPVSKEKIKNTMHAKFNQESRDLLLKQSFMEDNFGGGSTFDPVRVDNLSEQDKLVLAGAVNQLYNHLKLSKDNPTFEDVVRFYMEKNDIKKADKNFHKLYRGWQLANLPALDVNAYSVVYNNVFNNLDNAFQAIDNVSPSDLTEVQTQQRAEETEKQENTELEKKDGKKETDRTGSVQTIGKDLDTENTTLVFTSIKYKSVNTVAEDGTVTVSYEKVEEDFNRDPFTPGALKLLHPDMYGNGVVLTASIHPQFMEVPVYNYNKDGTINHNLPPVPFSQWLDSENTKRKAAGNKLITETSPEYIAKVPMAYTDQDGVVVAYVTNMDRISLVHNTPATVAKYKASTLAIRTAVANNKTAEVVVVEKDDGHKNDLALDYDKIKLLKDADPTSVLALVDIGADGMSFKFGDGRDKIPLDQIGHLDMLKNQLIAQHSKLNNFVELRQSGVINTYDADGKLIESKPRYFPLLTIQSDKLNESSQSTIYWAINTYLNKNKPEHPDNDKFKNIIKSIAEITGGEIDLNNVNANIKDLGRLLQWFVYTIDSGKPLGNTNDDKITNIIRGYQGTVTEDTNKPFIFSQGGVFVIGNAYGYDKNDATSIELANDRTMRSLHFSYEDDFMDQLEAHLPNLKANASLKGLGYQGKVPTINRDGSIGDGYESYDDYLRNTVRTKSDAKKTVIDTNDGPKTVYISFVQPRIEVALGTKPKSTQVPIQHEPIELTTSGDKLFEYNGKMLNKEEFNDVINAELKALESTGRKFGEQKDESTHDPIKLTEQVKADIAKKSELITGINPTHQRQIIDYIYNNIAKLIIASPTKSISLDSIKKSVLETLNKDLGDIQQDREAKIKKYSDINNSNPGLYPKMPRLIAGYQDDLVLLQIIRDNWERFQEDALTMVKKYMNVKEGTITNLEDAETEEDDEFFIEESTETDHDHTKTSLEVNNKQSISGDIKRLCQSIEATDKTGNVVPGILGLPTYIGFDTIFNDISAWLAETGADYNTMKEILKSYAETHTWITAKNGLLSKLDDYIDADTKQNVSREMLRNKFVTAMTKHALDMEFLMMQKDRNGNYSLKIYSTNSGAIATSLMETWKDNFKQSKLLSDDVNNQYVYQLDAIREVLEEYEGLKDTSNIPNVVLNASQAIDRLIDRLIKEVNNQDKEHTFTLEGFTDIGKGQRDISLKDEPVEKEKLLKFIRTGKAKYDAKNGTHFTIEHLKDDTFRLKLFKQEVPPTDKIISFLDNFGIRISEETAKEIINGHFKYDNQYTVQWEDQWTGETNGVGKSLFGVLAGTLRKIETGITTLKEGESIVYDGDDESSSLLSQSIIKSLAHMEAKHTNHRVVQSFYDNHKSIYGFTAPKYITDRVRQLKLDPKQSSVLNELLQVSFNKNSFWLDLLANDSKFRDDFKVIHLGLTAMKELGKTLYRDNELQKLSDIDHELVKLGFFQATGQGNVTRDQKKYRGLDFRIGRMFSLTMSDKSTMTMIKTAVLNITKSTLEPINYKALLDFSYSQMIAPEMQRISGFRNIVSNDKGYSKGGNMFFLMPMLNTMKVTDNGQETTILNLLNSNNYTSLSNLEGKIISFNGNLMTVKEALLQKLDDHIKAKQQEKLEVWEKAKFISKDETDLLTKFAFLDKGYMKERGGNVKENIEIAALDYTLNSMIANANSFMAIAGDPAQCFKQTEKTKAKEKEDSERDYIQTAEDTFTEVGKRLASQIAPRNKLADSDNPSSKYYQLMMEDVVRVSHQIKYITKALDGIEITDQEIEMYKNGTEEQQKAIAKKFPNTHMGSNNYFQIGSTDSQEYTTWREHLYVLEKMGKMENNALAITQDEIDQARKIFSSNLTLKDLSKAEQDIIQKVLQPMKPVYTGQILDTNNDLMRTVYIKTSSFPLIPQLTAGMEIDKLTKAMEKLEREKGMTVRASFQSGNKVGSLKNPLVIADTNGNFLDLEAMSSDDLAKFALILPRSGFGIQQNIPIKSDLKDVDTVSMGTQITKLSFGNIVMQLKDFSFNGKPYTGQQLQQEFTRLFNGMVTGLKSELYTELGLDPTTGRPPRGQEKNNLERLAKILKSEATLRGYPQQDFDALGINPETNSFNLPIWLSANSNRYEALLMSIVTHRITKIKFPGYSYVSGSQTGFKMQEGMQGVDQSQVVFTDAWTGELKSNQVLMPCKLRVNGEIIDIKQYSKRNAEGLLVVDTDKIDPDLLKDITSFRIPSSKHSSMESIEIAGFLPAQSADLIIVSMDGTVAMGEDYDVDKRYTYHQWTTVEDDKIIPLHKSKKYNQEGQTVTETIDERIKLLTEELHDYKKAINDKKNKIRKLSDKIIKLSDDLPFIYGMKYARTEKEYNRLVDKLEKLDDEELNTEISDKYKELRELKADKTKVYQNQILDIHAAVLKHPEVKKLTVEKLTTDEAAKDAEFLEEITKKKDPYFTPLSDEYQKHKFASGAAGRNGTAAYSLDVVSQSLFEQSFNNGNPVSLKREIIVANANGEGVHKEFPPLEIQFGKQKSNGVLGRSKTLDNELPIADVHSERQNLMVDNEKLQIAIRVFLNDYTMKVDKVLNFLGFNKGEALVDETNQPILDKDGKEIKNSISFLFISQPIIKQYVTMLEGENSNTSEYDAQKKEKIIAKILAEYDIEDQDAIVNMDSEMTNNYMVSQIKDNGSNKMFQAAVLMKFLELEGYGDTITSIETLLNIDSKGCGKNLIESTEKLESIVKLIPKTAIPSSATVKKGTSLVEGASDLIGDYFVGFNDDVDELIKKVHDGYIVVSSDPTNDGRMQYVMIKPKTVAGIFAINGLVAANEVWAKFFPYKEPAIKNVFQEVIDIIGNSEMKESKIVEIKQLIFKDMKKYLYTDTALKVLGDDAQTERKRLFFDTKKSDIQKGKPVHQSLAMFLDNLSKSKSEDVKRLLRSNRLLQRFTYSINTNGKLSTIKFNNAAAENFDEQYLYNSIIELMESNIDLGVFNGKPYNSSDLAQDLVAYSYLEGGVQEAVQFVKYIPVSYLMAYGINKIVKDENGASFIGRNTLGTKSGQLSQFTYQFIQHHPGLVKKITEDNMTDTQKFKSIVQINKKDLSTLVSFTYDNGTPIADPFISIYNDQLPKGESKFQLYALNMTSGQYERIPVLGAFGMSEYMAQRHGYTSLINRPNATYKQGVEVSNQENETFEGEIVKLSSDAKEVHTVVEAISKLDSPMGRLAKKVLPIMGTITKFEIVVTDKFNGVYNPDTNTISISKNFHDTATDEEFATTIMRETIHSISDKELRKNVLELPFDPSIGYRQFVPREVITDGVVQPIPTHIKRLISIFSEAQKELNKDGKLKELTRKLNKTEKEGLTDEEYDITYAGYDIFEFVERMMTSTQVQEKFNNTPFRDSGISIGQKFWEWVSEMLSEVQRVFGIDAKQENITANAIASVFEIFEAKKQAQSTNTEAEITLEKAKELNKGLFNDDGTYNPDNEEDQFPADFDNLGTPSSYDPVKISNEKVGMISNTRQLLKLLGASMYNAPVTQVTVKELLQNSFDAIKARQNSTNNKNTGNIHFDINTNTRTISITDDGIGMSPEIVKSAFLGIGGTNKEGLSTGERSGGLGLAKVQFIMASESIVLETVKDGIKTTFTATPEQLLDSEVQLRTEPTTKLSGTTIKIKIPKTYTTTEGTEKIIDFVSSYRGWKGFDILTKPLIGNANITVDINSRSEFDTNKDKIETIPIGSNIDKTMLPPHFANITFDWGTADLYMSTEKKDNPKHQILSSGIYQFNYGFNDSNWRSIPYDIVVNIKPSVAATSEQYPFNNQRENFKNTVLNDIKSLNSYLLKYASGEAEKEAASVFSDIKPLPQIDPNKILTPEERDKLYSDLNKRVAENKKNNPSENNQTTEYWKNIMIAKGQIINQETKESVNEKDYNSSFKTDKNIENVAPVNTEFFNSAFPQFHNNTNIDYMKFPGAIEFFTDFGNTVLQMVRFVGDTLGYDYKKLATNSSEKFFAGISIDKSYGGVHIRKIINAIFVNPLAFSAENMEEAIGIALHATIHEINHTTASGENASFTTDLAKLYGKIYGTNKYGLYEGLFRSVYKKHFETYKTLKNEYDKSTTRNLSVSFEGNNIKGSDNGSVQGNETNVYSGQTSQERNQRDTGNSGQDKIGDVIASKISKQKTYPASLDNVSNAVTNMLKSGILTIKC